MTDKQILEEVDKAMKLGRKEAYADVFCIVSNMYVTDGSKSLGKLLNILHEKFLSTGKEVDLQESEE